MRINWPASGIAELLPDERPKGARFLALYAALCISIAAFSSTAFAIGPPDKESPSLLIITEIESVFDYDNGDTLVIRGENFDKGLPAVVTLGGFGALDVVTETPTEIIVRCPAPDYLCPAGDYRLSVSVGDKKDDSDVYALTIGAVGPQGPAGENGEQGPSGVVAVGSGLVGSGTPENLTLSVDYPNLETSSLIHIESTGDEVRITANGGSVIINPDGSIRIASTETISVVGGGQINMEATASMLLKSGSSELRIDPAGVSLSGSVVKIDGKGSVKMKAPITQVQGDASLDLDGGIISIN